MKHITILALFLILSCKVFAQANFDDLKNGSYIKNKYAEKFAGNWFGKVADTDVLLKLNTTKQTIKRGHLNFTADVVLVKVLRFIKYGKDLTHDFATEIELMSIDGDTFSGILKDPVTSNKIRLKLSYVSENECILSGTLPEMDVENDVSKGTVFPFKITLNAYK